MKSYENAQLKTTKGRIVKEIQGTQNSQNNLEKEQS